METSPISTITLSRKLKFHQLMIFELVLESGSFVRAANAMSLTQPAITKAIYDLELFFGSPLFERSNRGVTPTEFGVMLGRRVKSLIAETRYMTEEVNAFRTGEAGHVIVGTLISASAKLLPRAIVALRKATPGVLITVREGTTAQMFPALATGDLDIVVGRLPEQELPLSHAFPLKHEVLFHESFCAVVGCDHPLADSKGLSIADLMTEEWIFPLQESPSYNAVEKFFRDSKLGLPPHHVNSLSILTNIGLLLETDMIALMPRAAALQFVKAGLIVVLDLTKSANFGEVGFSIRADKDVNPACKNFIKCLRETAKSIFE
ncbi:LysR family transcriptional regulator [Pseudomonas reactans]|jgi:DNA-binding transcriptional LysR family regulator|uniref:LysR family transcriptional regulator n=3 Tax=Pseudomonas TaxID=286 RepID=A0A7Y7ZIZ0_9PSED|nr:MULTISPECIES: LysR family transcriptional regulator [Pseudomonas]ASV34830.1 LysR family transcriptional regulator [Pseudomonas sp. NS1(2017)]KGE67600.1 LysR family transcriptional regulator [Pseudomonas fluorescens LMG 5329]NWA45660.1 LysR family transcriptional regulator [Pseudomonas reactans]NWB30111.1 LysR family transcriptional regulator [Pseudomonas gingeri]NWC36585.1 LysR family transcriptional regulator [Pseudomonas gingeri]